jgi:hypothetical protein
MGAGYLGKKAMSMQSMEQDRLESFYRRAVWVERFAWRPRRCNITGRRLWLTRTMMGVAMWTGPGDPVFEFKWHDYKEHTAWLLKQ